MTPSVDQAHVDAAAGIAETRIESHDGLGRFPSVRAMLSADLRGWLPQVGIVLEEAVVETILSEGERALAGYTKADGSVEFSSPAIIVSATVA